MDICAFLHYYPFFQYVVATNEENVPVQRFLLSTPIPTDEEVLGVVLAAPWGVMCRFIFSDVSGAVRIHSIAKGDRLGFGFYKFKCRSVSHILFP